MERVREDDEQAFEQLQQFYSPRLAAFMRKRHRYAADVEDLVQEVFFRIWKNRKDYWPGTLDWPYLKGSRILS